jgi:hypothetical protein
MRKPPSVQLPALFVRLPVATHDLLRGLAAAADESVSRYVVTLIEQQRVGGPQLPPQRLRKVVAPQPVEEPVAPASEEPVRRKRGRPRKTPLAPPVEVVVKVAPVVPVEEPPRRPRGRPRKVPAEVVATPPHKRTPRVEAVPVEESVAAARAALVAFDPEHPAIAALDAHEARVVAPVKSRLDTLDRIRAALAALARLEEPPVEELADESASRVVLEESP